MMSRFEIRFMNIFGYKSSIPRFFKTREKIGRFSLGSTLTNHSSLQHSDNGQDERLAFGVSSMQGWRISMEDAHAAVLDLQVFSGDKFEAAPPEKRLSFFGVYDGHGGERVAIYSGENVHKIIAKQDAFKEESITQALKDGFLATDRAILNDPKYEEEMSGCTACVGLISHNKIWVGNAGDSRAVLGVKGRAKPLSYDHKPQNEAEKARISAAGGFVDFGRVNGNLALSRALGDFDFKKSADLSPEQQIVTAFPDVIEHEISGDDEFVVIACDGIWDCKSNQEVVEFVRRGIVAKQSLSTICENMMDTCCATSSDTGGVGCDNMTMIVIALLAGKTKDEWYQMVADRVGNGDGPCAPADHAENRGPGLGHVSNGWEDTDGYELDMDQRTRDLGGRPGRIILLGDGKEVLTDSDEMDQDEDDPEAAGHGIEEEPQQTDEEAAARSAREATPGPEPAKDSSGKPHASTELHAANDSDMPTKLFNKPT